MFENHKEIVRVEFNILFLTKLSDDGAVEGKGVQKEVFSSPIHHSKATYPHGNRLVHSHFQDREKHNTLAGVGHWKVEWDSGRDCAVTTAHPLL